VSNTLSTLSPSASVPVERPDIDQSSGPRVLVVAPQPFYTDRGTPIATRYLIEALLTLGYQVDVLTYPMGESLDIAGVDVSRLPNPLKISRVPIGFSWRKCWLDAFLFSGITSALRAREYSCVTAVEEAAFVAALVAPRYGVPVLYDMQSSLAEQLGHMAPFQNGVGRTFVDGCERWLLDHVDLVMTSAGLAERVRKASPRAVVREWRYPGMEESATSAEIDRLRTDLDLGGAGPVIVYGGNFAEYQGLAPLIEATSTVLLSFPDAVLVLVGAGCERELKEVRRLTACLPDGSTRVLKRQTRTSMRLYYGLADVLVSPRQFGENLPLKVLDYMVAGGPIVATDIPAHRTVLEEDRAALVGIDGPALASGILALLRDDERRRRVGQNARAFAREKLGWLRYVQSVGEAFHLLVGDARRH
jgi:glycosyltransferase involved in cell wall biosynthesis